MGGLVVWETSVELWKEGYSYSIVPKVPSEPSARNVHRVLMGSSLTVVMLS